MPKSSTLFFISFAAGCCAGSLAAYVSLSITYQCLIALAITLVTFSSLSKLFANKKQPKHVSNVDALIGQLAIVTHSIEPHATGRVKVNGEEWVATTSTHTHLENNTLVVILGIEGNKLIVKTQKGSS